MLVSVVVELGESPASALQNDIVVESSAPMTPSDASRSSSAECDALAVVPSATLSGQVIGCAVGWAATVLLPDASLNDSPWVIGWAPEMDSRQVDVTARHVRVQSSRTALPEQPDVSVACRDDSTPSVGGSLQAAAQPLQATDDTHGGNGCNSGAWARGLLRGCTLVATGWGFTLFVRDGPQEVLLVRGGHAGCDRVHVAMDPDHPTTHHPSASHSNDDDDDDDDDDCDGVTASGVDITTRTSGRLTDRKGETEESRDVCIVGVGAMVDRGVVVMSNGAAAMFEISISSHSPSETRSPIRPVSACSAGLATCFSMHVRL
jgi:hypothetical protein